MWPRIGGMATSHEDNDLDKTCFESSRMPHACFFEIKAPLSFSLSLSLSLSLSRPCPRHRRRTLSCVARARNVKRFALFERLKHSNMCHVHATCSMMKGRV